MTCICGRRKFRWFRMWIGWHSNSGCPYWIDRDEDYEDYDEDWYE